MRRALTFLVVAACCGALAGGAQGGDQPLDGAPDSQVAGYVESPYTPQNWGGDGLSATDLYADVGSGYNASAVGDVIGTIEAAGEASGFSLGLGSVLAVAPEVGLAAGTAYLTYKVGGLFYSWLFGGMGGTGTGEVGAWAHVTSGQVVTIGELTTGQTEHWTVPADGFLLESGGYPVVTDGNHIQENWTYPGSCNGGAYSAQQAAMGAPTTTFGGSFEGCNAGATMQLSGWYKSATDAAAGAHLGNVGTTAPSGEPQNGNCTGSGVNGYGCTGSAFNNANPSTATIAAALRTTAENGQHNQALGELNCVVLGDCATTPIDNNYTTTMPSCAGLTAAACTEELDGLGFQGSIVETTLSEDGAVLTYPAGSIVETSPAGGAQVDLGTAQTVTFTENPNPLPIIVPDPGVNQTEDEWANELDQLGYTGTITVTQLTDAQTDTEVGPNGIALLTTARGTFTVPGWPEGGVRIEPDEALKVEENPADAPPVGGPPNPSDCGSCAIDWTPLESLSLTGVFPFGVIAWLEAGFSSLAPSGTCPTLTVPTPSFPTQAATNVPISFCSSEWSSDFQPWVFPFVEALITLLAVLFVALKVIGIGGDTS